MVNRKILIGLLATVIGFGLYVAGWFHGTYYELPWPLRGLLAMENPESQHSLQESQGHDHAADGHKDHAHGEDVGEFIDLSEVAKKNLGLTDAFLKPIQLQTYRQVISVPAIVVDLPGRTRLPISATMNGIVTHIHAVAGEAVEPGDLILEMRLTHEDLVTAQKEFLQTLGDRDIERKEILRLEGAANSGAISTKSLLDRQYLRDKLESLLRSQRESLRLHGLTMAQIENIETNRRLLAEMKVFASEPDVHADDETHGGSGYQTRDQRNSQNSPSPRKHTLVLQEMNVQKGQSVNAGEALCVLADYDELLIEGQAFENEAVQISKAKVAGWPLTANITSGSEVERIDNLSLSWLNNEIDATTRTFKFFVSLQNNLIDDRRNKAGQRHVAWKYRVGQRMQLGVPVAEWIDQIVLPVDAVVRDAVESYVFQQNGDRYQRIAVHEKHRDHTHVVLENDGSVFAGDVVALRGAHQMQMALKSKSGAGIDPHAGHSH